MPFGFRIENGRLIEDSEEFQVIARMKRMRHSGKSIPAISKRVGLSVGKVHQLLNVNLRTLKAKYASRMQGRAFHKANVL